MNSEMESAQAAFDASNCKSLYVGNLNPKITDDLLRGIFSAIAPLESCKLIKDKITGESSGYGFVDYFEHHSAAIALQGLNGKSIYGNEIKVNWAFASGQKEDTSNHYHIFVGDLSPEVDDKALFTAFSAFGSISNARVMLDQGTGRSRGYGFVAFRNKEDADRALNEMNGEWLGSRAIRCNWANQKIGGQLAQADFAMSSPTLEAVSPTNTTVYVGGLTPDVHESTLVSVFTTFGEIAEVRNQRDKGYAFVRYSAHDSAKAAIAGMNGQLVGSRPVKCSWGKERTATTTGGPTGVMPPPVHPPPAWGGPGYMGGYQMPYQQYPPQPYPYYPYGGMQYPQYGAPQQNMYNNGYDSQAYGNYYQKS